MSLNSLTKNNQPAPAADSGGRIKGRIKSAQAFFNKFNNDWVMNQAAGLAYNLMTAIVPIAIALVSILGFTLGNLDASANAQFVAQVKNAFPSSTAQSILPIVLTSLSQRAGVFAIIAALASVFGGSRLFISIEGYFDIIYRTSPRKVIQQNVMAILMMLAFLVLIPLMVVASSLPALLRSLSQMPVINLLPGVEQLTNNGIFVGIVGILSSVLISWVLFMAIYMVVPNERISFHHSWRGAVVAAVALEAFLALFPFYITHFMGSYTGTAGFLFILLVFFYYFAVILLFGAEVNAYFVSHIPPLPNNIANVLKAAVAPDAKAEPVPSNEKTDPVPSDAQGEPVSSDTEAEHTEESYAASDVAVRSAPESKA